MAKQLHFIIPENYAEFEKNNCRYDIINKYPYWIDGQFNWSAQSWLVLREYREGITIGTKPIAGCVNFAHCMVWRSLGQRCGEFRVSFRADFPRLFDVDIDVIQNPSVKRKAYQIYLPYWPVPGLIPRDSRRADISTIAYAGRIGPRNLAPELQDLAEDGRLFGLKLRIISPDMWHDLSDVDLLLAVRSLDRRQYGSKPPSKLFSAWRGRIPLIAGWDSAFSYVGRPGLDYERVDSLQSLRDTVMRLREDSDSYSSIVARGRRRAKEFSHESIAGEWLRAVDGPINAAFEGYMNRGPRSIQRSLDQARNFISYMKRVWRERKRVQL